MKKNWTVPWNEDDGAPENARQKLPDLAAAYFATGSAVAHEGSTAEELHQLRLATKHFRYTLEAFRPVYGESLESRLAQLKQVQQYLGDINDCRVARERFESDPGAALFLEFLDARLAALRTEFLSYWKKQFQASNSVEKWRTYLGPERKPATTSGNGHKRSGRQAKAV